jgi:hypothetical protein
MQTLPMAAVPSQNFSAALNGQAVTINLYQLGALAAAALYMDLIANGAVIFTGRICRAYGGEPGTVAPFMLSGAYYRGFEGDFVFLDTQSSANVPTADPQYAGLGNRWQLIYLSPADLEAGGLGHG